MLRYSINYQSTDLFKNFFEIEDEDEKMETYKNVYNIIHLVLTNYLQAVFHEFRTRMKKKRDYELNGIPTNGA
jgi:hypothetical protein